MVPQSLRTWFIIHFVVDLLAGVPLLIAPGYVSGLTGILPGEPFVARLVAAAFLAIGTTSLLRRHDSLESYQAMLTLKIIWSSLALVGLFLSAGAGASPGVYGPIAIFIPFWIIWIYYYKKITTK